MLSGDGRWRSLPVLYCFFSCLVIVLGTLVWGVHVGHARSQAPEAEAIESAFRGAVSMWAGERFESLWERPHVSRCCESKTKDADRCGLFA